jgi:transcriptional regulator with XRE-family HTH domain
MAAHDAQNITNDQLGKRIGVSHAMASRLRHGKRLPSVEVIRNIRKEFGIDGNKLIDAHCKGPEAFGRLFSKAIEADCTKRAA